MFEFFKKKIKGAFSKFSQEVDEEAETIEEETTTEEQISPENPTTTNDNITSDKEAIKKESNTSIEESEGKKDVKVKNEKQDKTEDEKTKVESEEKKQDQIISEESKKESNKETNTSKKESEQKSEDDEQKQTQEDLEKETLSLIEEEKAEDSPTKTSFFEKINFFKKKEKTVVTNTSTKIESTPEEDENDKDIKEEVTASTEIVDEEKKSFIGKISDSLTKKKLSESKFNELFWDLEIALLENNVAVEVVDLLKSELKNKLVDNPIARSKISVIIEQTLKETVEKIFEIEPIDLPALIANKKPYKILVVGINGSGKTTSIAKLCQLFKDEGLSPVVAAADTFRAAAIDQLEEHTDKLGVKIIKHDYGSDPAAVAFDAIKYAEAKGKDVVIIDTAGRLHSNANLMDELKKVNRISNPDFTIFIGESITGNDCVEQAKEFNKAVNIDGIILSKADIDEKGGAAVSISYVLGKPILYLGIGQEYKDLEVFNKDKMMYRMFGTELGKTQ